MTKVAFLGTGIMGAPMCRNLVANGVAVTAWNRSPEKLTALTEVTIAPTAAAAVADAEFVFLMLSDGPACASVLAELYPVLTAGSTVIVMSTTDLVSIKEQAAQCTAAGVNLVDAPVSGGEKGAIEATLSIMVGASAEDFASVKDLLGMLGTPHHLGPVGSGQLTKLANQIVVALTIAAVAQGFVLAEAGGADLAAVREALLGGFANSTIMEQHGLRMIANDFEPGGPSRHQLKDLRNALAAGKELGLKLEQLELVEKLFTEYVDTGGGDKDHSGIIELIRQRAKL